MRREKKRENRRGWRRIHDDLFLFVSDHFKMDDPERIIIDRCV
jgi:hypothetical protein